MRWLVHLAATGISWVGYGAVRAGATRLARSLFLFAHKISPHHFQALRFSAWCLRETGDSSGAIAYYRELLKRYPSFVDGRVELGYAFGDVERYPEAIEQFEQALDHEPPDAEARRGLAAMLLSINHSADVISVCEELLRDSPADWVGWWYLGTARTNTFQWNDALAAFETAQALHSHTALAYDHANVLIQMDRFVEAEAVVKAALATYPSDRILRALLACILMEVGRHVDAETLLQEILREDPADVPARHVLAALLGESARPAEAAAVAERLRTEFPEEATTHATLGWVALKAGRSQDALTAYEAAERIEPGRLDFTAGRATALKRLGRNSEAEALVSALVGRDPSYFDHNAWCAELTTLRYLNDQTER